MPTQTEKITAHIKGSIERVQFKIVRNKAYTMNAAELVMIFLAQKKARVKAAGTAMAVAKNATKIVSSTSTMASGNKVQLARARPENRRAAPAVPDSSNSSANENWVTRKLTIKARAKTNIK